MSLFRACIINVIINRYVVVVHADSCPTLCNPMDYTLPGFTVLHYLLEFAQIHWHHWHHHSTGIFIQSVMPFNCLILCCPLHLLSSNFPNKRIFSNESALCIRWPKYWRFSISSSNEYSGLISFRIDCFDLLAGKELSSVFSSTTVLKHQFFGALPSLWSNSHIHPYCKKYNWLDRPLLTKWYLCFLIYSLLLL